MMQVATAEAPVAGENSSGLPGWGVNCFWHVTRLVQ